MTTKLSIPEINQFQENHRLNIFPHLTRFLRLVNFGLITDFAKLIRVFWSTYVTKKKSRKLKNRPNQKKNPYLTFTFNS